MPFIGTQLNRFTAPPVELILDHLLIVSCDNIVTLHAQVIHELVGNRYQWYQISGSTITWLTPTNELTVMFQQTLVRDDKIFRLYANQGTPSEVHADILVTAVPTDNAPEIRSSHRLYAQANQNKSYADSEVAVSKVIPGLSASGTASFNNPLRGVMFNSPSVTAVPPGNFILPSYYGTLVSNLLVYDVTGGTTDTLLASIPYYSRGYFSFPSNHSVRVDTVVSRDNYDHIAKGIPAGYYPPAGFDIDTFDPCTVSLSGSRTLKQTFNSTVYVNIFQNVTDSFAPVLLNNNNGLYNTYTRYPLSLEVCPTVIDYMTGSLQKGFFYQTYLRLDLGVGGLG